MSLVIDASIALRWCFADEAMPATDAINQRVASDGAFVPAIWRLEVANTLLQPERRGRITQPEIAKSLTMLRDLAIETDQETVGHAFRETLMLARAHRLTASDACYLELALRRGLPLATLDNELAAAGS
ncbi:MAG: type II toxin-antitoxin system VapC family toxin [Beijerinckiaceae bacterium]|nr:type II toxin-antitoxin system VapC family toxin [Beijerinckiaceae bacterium]